MMDLTLREYGFVMGRAPAVEVLDVRKDLKLLMKKLFRGHVTSSIEGDRMTFRATKMSFVASVSQKDVDVGSWTADAGFKLVIQYEWAATTRPVVNMPVYDREKIKAGVKKGFKEKLKRATEDRDSLNQRISMLESLLA